MAKSIFEFLPVFIFLISFELTDNFFIATFILIATTILFTFWTFTKQKRLPFIALFICLETTFFGGLTLIFNNPAFVQMRDTFYDFILGCTIFITALFGNPIIKKFFGHIFDLSIETWRSLSYMWGPLLILFAAMNEYFRRNFPEDVWIKYKMAVVITTICFGLFLFWKFRKQVSDTDII